MHKQLLICLLVIAGLAGCKTEEAASTVQKYQRWVGNIAFDASRDDPNFELCNREDSVRQYFWGNGLQYRGEKRAIIRIFEDNYVPVPTTDTGLALAYKAREQEQQYLSHLAEAMKMYEQRKIMFNPYTHPYDKVYRSDIEDELKVAHRNVQPPSGVK